MIVFLFYYRFTSVGRSFFTQPRATECTPLSLVMGEKYGMVIIKVYVLPCGQ